jgi:hypothetical protein
MLKGGCFCGFVRYEAHGAARDATNCHCSMCRRICAAPFVAWFTVGLADLRFVAGQPARFRSSAHAERSFCPRCGTPLTFQSRHFPDEIDVTTCSLDDPESVPPQDHTRTSAQLSWVKLGDGLPRFAEGRE